MSLSLQLTHMEQLCSLHFVFKALPDAGCAFHDKMMEELTSSLLRYVQVLARFAIHKRQHVHSWSEAIFSIFAFEGVESGRVTAFILLSLNT